MEAERTKMRDSIFPNRAAQKRIEHLRQCQYYIETKVTEENLRKQLERQEFRLKTLQSRFGTWKSHRTGGVADLLRQYTAETGMKQIKTQIKTLKYLLGE